jgi:small subunit ribosomal protein S9
MADKIIKKIPKEEDSKTEKYFQAVGRRKKSISIVRLFTKKATDKSKEDKALIKINDKDYGDYFSDKNLEGVVESPLRKLKSLSRFKATVKVMGGGFSGQAGAIKYGLSKALVLFDANFRKKLKKSGFLTRDPRAKERRKYGLKKARKAPQWQKR